MTFRRTKATKLRNRNIKCPWKIRDEKEKAPTFSKSKQEERNNRTHKKQVIGGDQETGRNRAELAAEGRKKHVRFKPGVMLLLAADDGQAVAPPRRRQGKV